MPPTTLWTIPAAGGSPHQLTETGNPVGGHGAPSWSPDGKRIVFAASYGNGGGIWSVSSTGGDLQNLFKGHGFSPVYSSDGRSVYFAGGDRAGASWALLRLSVSPETGMPLGEVTIVKNTGSTLYKHLRVSSDGKKIACSALQFKNDLVTISLDPGLAGGARSPVALTHDTNYRKLAASFSPDGSKLAYNVVRIGSTDELWIIDADGKNPTQVSTDRIMTAAGRAGYRTVTALHIPQMVAKPCMRSICKQVETSFYLNPRIEWDGRNCRQTENRLLLIRRRAARLIFGPSP
jgi:Tol biopolymer transport system component